MAKVYASTTHSGDSEETSILLISGDEKNTNAMKHMLLERGLDRVRSIQNGLEALKLLVDTPFDIVLVDQKTKFISGWQFVKEFKQSELTPNTPLLLFGNEKPFASLSELNEYGILQYIRLPFKSSELGFLIQSSIYLNKASGTVENNFTLAKEALTNEQTEEALSKFQELKETTKGTVRSSFGLAHAHVLNKDFEAAESEMAEIVEKSGAYNAAALYFKVQMQAKNNNLREAAESAIVLLNEETENPYYYAKCAELFLKQMDFTTTLNICELADLQLFDTPEFDLIRAKTKYLQGDVKEAISITMFIESKDGPSKETVNLRGICFRKIKNYTGAIECYEAALALSPMDARLYFNIGLCWAAMEEPQTAIDSFSMALKIVPSFSKAQEKIDELTLLIEEAS